MVVEYESAAGVTNLVKYWPLLASGSISKGFIIVHVFQVGGEGDYLSHRLLWAFLADRMTVDLARQGIERPSAWEAKLFTYRRGETAPDAVRFVRECH